MSKIKLDLYRYLHLKADTLSRSDAQSLIKLIDEAQDIKDGEHVACVKIGWFFKRELSDAEMHLLTDFFTWMVQTL